MARPEIRHGGELPTFWFPPRRTLSSGTGLRETAEQRLEFLTTAAGLEEPFPLHCGRTCVEVLGMHNDPGRIVKSRFRNTMVMLIQTAPQIRGIADVQPVRPNTLQNVNCERHIQREMARPERFELPTFWFVARRSIQLS